MSNLQLAFFGLPETFLNGQAVRFPTKKTLALLAYLVCESGLHTREKLAGIFWANHDESGGRTALRKALGFLKAALGESEPAFLLAARETLGFNLDANLRADFLDLELAAKRVRLEQTFDDVFRVHLERIVAVRGEFLTGVTLLDAADFDSWLELKRESLRRDLDLVLQTLITLQCRVQKFEVALVTARRRLQLDTMNEAAHRGLIELHLAINDRHAALEAFKACQTILERELGISPSPETVALVAQTRTNPQPLGVSVQPKTTARAAPKSVFVGREREWALLEEAWQNNQIVYIAGEPGSGKTRLMHEFLKTKGEYFVLDNRPGDMAIPYSSLSRHLRILFQRRPVTLEPWVKLELARILPEMGEIPAPIESGQGKLRFLQAIAETVKAVIDANHSLLILHDDVQFNDVQSSEATEFMLTYLDIEVSMRSRALNAHRTGELNPEGQKRLAQSVGSNQGVLIELAPLNARALQTWLKTSSRSQFGEKDLSNLAKRLERFTGGNPLFVLETLKELADLEHNQVFNAQLFEINSLPRSSKVFQVITRRIERLSKPAKDLLRVAAILNQEYTFEHAAKVLEQNPLPLSEASEELEVHGFLQDNRFTHDLLFETTLASIPKVAKTLLHDRVFRVLKEAGAGSGVLFVHALGSENHQAIYTYGLLEGNRLSGLCEYALSRECFDIAEASFLKIKQPSSDQFSQANHLSRVEVKSN